MCYLHPVLHLSRWFAAVVIRLMRIEGSSPQIPHETLYFTLVGGPNNILLDRQMGG